LRWIDTPGSALEEITKFPMPRMLRFEPPKFVEVKLTFGVFICRSEVLMICRSSSMVPENALTAMGTSWMLSWRRWAETMTSSMAFDEAACSA
jgi:hypothetical protein